MSSWGSNEELAAFFEMHGGRFEAFVKADCLPEPGECLEDDLLIRPDKNPNTAAARALFDRFDDGAAPIAQGTDLVLVWGEGFDFTRVPAGARVIYLNAYASPDTARVDVFIPVSVQTERRGHYTNFQGVVSAFEPCFPKPASIADAQALFAAWVPSAGGRR